MSRDEQAKSHHSNLPGWKTSTGEQMMSSWEWTRPSTGEIKMHVPFFGAKSWIEQLLLILFFHQQTKHLEIFWRKQLSHVLPPKVVLFSDLLDQQMPKLVVWVGSFGFQTSPLSSNPFHKRILGIQAAYPNICWCGIFPLKPWGKSMALIWRGHIFNSAPFQPVRSHVNPGEKKNGISPNNWGGVVMCLYSVFIFIVSKGSRINT